jgi:DNA recombination protein Rad52
MGFSDRQVKALSAKLNAKFVRTRIENGKTLSYLEGWHVIAEANRIFGFDGWNRETLDARCIWDGVHKGQRQCSYVARVRVRVRARETEIMRDGSGAGIGVGITPGEAHEAALKAAETDAMKRALATFGNTFGLALYDRDQRGVRRLPSRSASQTSDRLLLRAGNGSIVSEHQDPASFCSAVRSELERLSTTEALGAFWTANVDAVQMLRRAYPLLQSDRGQHYAEILDGLYRHRLDALQATAPRLQGAGEGSRDAMTTASMALSGPRRIRDRDHLRVVATQPCLVCGRQPSHAHHVRHAQPRALARKVSDEWVVPLCAVHHRALHDAGNEERWWKGQSIDPLAVAERLWAMSRHHPPDPEPVTGVPVTDVNDSSAAPGMNANGTEPIEPPHSPDDKYG